MSSESVCSLRPSRKVSSASSDFYSFFQRSLAYKMNKNSCLADSTPVLRSWHKVSVLPNYYSSCCALIQRDFLLESRLIAFIISAFAVSMAPWLTQASTFSSQICLVCFFLSFSSMNESRFIPKSIVSLTMALHVWRESACSASTAY